MGANANSVDAFAITLQNELNAEKIPFWQGNARALFASKTKLIIYKNSP